MAEPQPSLLEPVAVVGLACRFPGAGNPQDFWRNLCQGVESVTFFSQQELLEAGLPQDLLEDPHYVRAKFELKGIELFDAEFFGFAPRQAELLDPQSRLFLECCWEALEDAGYDPLSHPGRTGVLAGAGSNFYLIDHLLPNPERIESAGGFRVVMGNELDSVASLVSYKLDLRGPAIAINTACSTSLVAVALACQSLANYQCDLALAGGVSLDSPLKQGYFWTPGGIDSRDGHCRAFDAQASGTVFGSGAGVVALKRLEDALADRDSVRAVIRGWAVNNDGALKAGYSAPGRDGQAEVIAEALELSGLPAESIRFVEAHGTGTELGDPIEVSALCQAFRLTTSKSGYCALGSVKPNIGHLDAAAGAAGLIKAVLALENRRLPPSLNFEKPNPRIDFESSPFYVNAHLQEFASQRTPLRAGVSSFGMGGTNAHLILEEAPPALPARTSRSHHLLVLSARSETALEQYALRLADQLAGQPEADLASICHTLQTGRRTFAWRRMLVAASVSEAAGSLGGAEPSPALSEHREQPECPVAFLFPGQGTPLGSLPDDLYRWAPSFRKPLDQCSRLLGPKLGFDARELLCPSQFAASQSEWRDAAGRQRMLQSTEYAQPVIFAFQFALAKTWMAWGIEPAALLGHSLGEWVAAALSGVFSLPDALSLVAERGRLMQHAPSGFMLAAALPESEARQRIGQGVALAAVNGLDQVVLSGPQEGMQRVQQELVQARLRCKRLPVASAFHSCCMDAVVKPFAASLKEVPRNAPGIPLISGSTGDWMSADQAVDAAYWASQLRRTVRFGDGLGRLLQRSPLILLEISAAGSLSALARRHPCRQSEHQALATLARRAGSPQAALLETLGRLWLYGAKIDWAAFQEGEQLNRVPLPTYPFQRRRYWVDPPVKGRRPSAPAQQGRGPQGEDRPAGKAPGRPQRLVKPAASRIEKELLQLWQELLGIEPLGIEDDFFELGGDSLLAVQMSARLRRASGLELPSRMLLEAPTIAALARRLSAAGKPCGAPSPLVELQPGNGRRPALFLVHPLGGHVFVFRDLARSLGAEQPVMAFQARGVDGESAPRRTVEEMADDYLQALQDVHPQGPVRLAGYSFGGAVAFEMARRLALQGRSVPLLALIDTPQPGPPPQSGPAVGEASPQALLEAHSQALESYSPDDYPDRLTYFRARQRERSDPGQPERFWLQRSAGGEVVEVAGDHFTILQEPQAEQLARLLLELLEGE